MCVEQLRCICFKIPWIMSLTYMNDIKQNYLNGTYIHDFAPQYPIDDGLLLMMTS